jgi:hypothetical protein
MSQSRKTSSADSRSVMLRIGCPTDEKNLARLAAFDSAEPLLPPVLVAEVTGKALAALSLSDGSVIADPFAPTAGLIELLRARGRQLDSGAEPRRPRLRLLHPWRLAFGMSR